MALDRTPWTDETVMPWGQHKDKKLEDIPAGYLLWLFEQQWITDWPGLHAYLRASEKHIRKEFEESGEQTEQRTSGEFTTFDDYMKNYRGF